MVEAKGKRVRGRLYPWGIVEGRPAFLFQFIIYSVLHVAFKHTYTMYNYIYMLIYMFKLILTLWFRSGELGTLWFREAEEHARSHAYARSEGRDPGDSLRELQSPLHPEHDPHGCEGTQPQVCFHCSNILDIYDKYQEIRNIENIDVKDWYDDIYDKR